MITRRKKKLGLKEQENKRRTSRDSQSRCNEGQKIRGRRGYHRKFGEKERVYTRRTNERQGI
jgi:hypothetical protein